MVKGDNCRFPIVDDGGIDENHIAVGVGLI
jgi:hypothetical protein